MYDLENKLIDYKHNKHYNIYQIFSSFSFRKSQMDKNCLLIDNKSCKIVKQNKKTDCILFKFQKLLNTFVTYDVYKKTAKKFLQ